MGTGAKMVTTLLIAVSIMACSTAKRGTPGPDLTAVPETSLVDEPVRIAVTGCGAGREVVLRTVLLDDDGTRWEGHATFEADAEGRVDPGILAPTEGTYNGVDPMGLFWSMQSDAGADGPLFAYDELTPLEVELQVEIDGEVLEAQQLTRLRILPNITRREVSERGLVGTLFIPEGQASLRAIIVLGGSGGGRSEDSAALLASHGFATLALAYFGEEPLPEQLVEIPLEYFEAAIEFLGQQDQIDADRIAVVGVSRGGELALLLGATFPQLRAIVAVVPSGVVWKGCCTPDAFQRPAWTFHGEPIVSLEYDRNDPDVQANAAAESRKMQSGELVAHTPGFRLAVEKATNLQAATIPVENTRGPILFISGEADALWPSSELAEISVRRLRASEFPFRFEHVSYEDAGHVFPYPFLPTTISMGPFLFGGTPAGNARAAVDAWSQIVSFYDDTLGR